MLGKGWWRRIVVVVAMTMAMAAQQGALAQRADEQRPAEAAGSLLALLPKPATSRHELALDGRVLPYQAEAGTLPLRDGTGRTTAAIFYTAYTADPPATDRPITFVFNGGPGAASAYLHLGGLGPRMLEVGDRGDVPPPPVRLVDNKDSWLAFTDLVFVDPIGTGYSRAADSAKESDFWGVEADATALSAFIRLYLQEKGRRLSPVFLAGESYGGFRVALLARRLQGDSGVTVSGTVLISPALEFSLIRGEDFDPLPWALALPSLAAVHLYGEGVDTRAAMAARLAPVERYALTDYLVALASGLESGGRATSKEVARITGLPDDVVARRFGRIPTGLFMKEHRRAEGEVVSRYDGTITSPDPRPQSSYPDGPDPVLDRLGAALTSGMVQYLREELGYKTDVTYRVLTGEISRKWDYGTSSTRQGYAGVAEDLQEARSVNPAMGVLIAHGYTDLATPYLAARYLVDQMPRLPGAAPTEVETYAGGHMMYLRPDSRRALADDVAALVARAVTRERASDPSP